MGGLGWVKKNGPMSISALDTSAIVWDVARCHAVCRPAAVVSP